MPESHTKRKELESVKNSGTDIFGEKTKEIETDIVKSKNEIDNLVFKLYGLNKDEIKQIEKLLNALNVE